MNQSSRTQTVSSLMKRIFKWPKFGRSAQKQIVSKSVPSWSSGTRSSPTATTGCLLGGLKTLARRVHPTVLWSRSLSFFTPNQMPSQKSLGSATVVQMAEYFTQRTHLAQSARSSRSNVASHESCTVVNIASRRASTCSEPSAFPLSSFQPREPMPPEDFSWVIPNELRTEPVYAVEKPVHESNWYPSTQKQDKKPVLTLVPKS